MYLKDLKSSDIQDTNERGSLPLGLIQGLIDSHDQPAEHPLVGGFGQSLDCKLGLLLSLGLLHIVPTNLEKGTGHMWMKCVPKMTRQQSQIFRP